MRKILLSFFGLLFFSLAQGQISFSNSLFNISSVSNQAGTELLCSDSSRSLKFQLTQESVQMVENFIIVDSQMIQIVPLKINGFTKALDSLDASEEKQLLSDYSKYELDYFKNELGISVLNPNNQWVTANSKNWYIWYFRVGETGIDLERKIHIQLFASTRIGDHILTINAPIFEGDNFAKGALIVNQMMETMKIDHKK